MRVETQSLSCMGIVDVWGLGLGVGRSDVKNLGFRLHGFQHFRIRIHVVQDTERCSCSRCEYRLRSPACKLHLSKISASVYEFMCKIEITLLLGSDKVLGTPTRHHLKFGKAPYLCKGNHFLIRME